MYVIDKSRFEAEELEQYEALIAKAKVDPEAYQEEMEDEIDDEMRVEESPDTSTKKKCKKKCTRKEEVGKMQETKKYAQEDSETRAALEAVQKELDEFKNSVEMEKFSTMAQKYAPLGKKEDELAQTLYNLKKSDEASYNAFVGILDEHLALVEKSGVFAEIGKSHPGTGAGSAVEKIEAAATEIQKGDPNMSREVAVMKAWENHPELIAEYEKEYNA